jgi:hypothetical protein
MPQAVTDIISAGALKAAIKREFIDVLQLY